VRAHEAGWAHAEGARKPAWLREPDEVDALVPQLWSATASKVDGVLAVGGVSLPDLAARFGTPAYVLDEADFRGRARAFRDAFADYDVYYAGKAFLCTAVARWVAEEGLCLDVCSPGELTVAVAAGVDPARIGYHGNNKTVPELERAVELGVGRIVLDSFHEIDRLSRIAEAAGHEVAVMVRVTAGVEAHTHEYIATAHEDQKFGFSITTGDAFEAVRRVLGTAAARAGGRLRLLGLHSHIGSQIFDSSGFEVAARRVLALHARVRDELGVVMPEMDLGGGFGIAYTTQDSPSTPATLAAEMSAIVAHECRALGLATPRLSIEPGRAIAGNTAILVTRVEAEKTKLVEAAPGRIQREDWLMVDAGFNTILEHSSYHWYFRAVVADRCSKPPVRPFRVGGPLCDGGDVYTGDPGSAFRYLPIGTKAGDAIAFLDVGAYSLECMSAYNGRDQAAAYMVTEAGLRRIAARRTVKDFVAGEHFVPEG